ncbi:MAG TPA: EAL domain-containing protein [Acidimicrobiales bacterium]|nr:EAL domain-containing protein [Acidimicrobiales bacterium]
MATRPKAVEGAGPTGGGDGGCPAPIGQVVPLRRPAPASFADLLAAERRQAEERLLQREAQLAETQRLASVGSWDLDVRSGVLTWTEELYRIFGVDPSRFQPSLDALLAVVHPEDRERVRATVAAAVQSGVAFDVEHRVVHAGGDLRWVHGRGRVELGPDGAPLRVFGTAQDVTERRATQESLVHQALHDPLTGLPNRLLFVDRVEQALRRRRRHDSGLALLFIDLDRFKLVNDTCGHAGGDAVLVAATARLQSVLRAEDTVARLGGDEFTVLCEDVDGPAVLRIAERALTALAAPVTLADGRQVVATASIGVAVVGAGDISAEELLADADSAMYQAKERGRNRLEVFDQSMRADLVARVEKTTALRRALDVGELRVHYQPEVRLSDESMSGVEALVRWQHPKLGLVGPDQVIALAEDTGLVVALGAQVLGMACREVASWQAAPGRGIVNLSVNLSARQLSEPLVIDTVWQALDETGLDPSRLCLEITESVLMDDVESSIEALLGLKSLGVRLAIDDFGTGYSSLSYLRRFPVDIVKIDRSFVSGLGTDPAAEAIVAAVVNLAHALGLVVVAEGVEDEQQVVMLRALGCDRAQGYLWSKPRPAAEVRTWRPPDATIASTEVDVRVVLEERVHAVEVQTGRPFVVQVPAALPAAQADWGALRTVVDHLLSNAVTYSSPDRPVVVSAGSGRRWVRISVADYGIGMTSAEVARCFEQFWQAPSSASWRRGRGTGIGLSNVRTLVEAMGGRVSVRSAPGKGSTFTVSVPRAGRGAGRPADPVPTPGVGEPNMVREFMRQLGVPVSPRNRRLLGEPTVPPPGRPAGGAASGGRSGRPSNTKRRSQ